MISIILIGLTTLFLLGNLFYFFAGHKYERSYFQSSLFQKLFFVMIGITFGFAVLYYILAMETTVLRMNNEEGEEGGENFLDYLYFSGVTMLSVGYGDLVPVGIARFFAILQAGVGLLLPTAFFVRAMHEREDNSKSTGDQGEKEGQGNYSDKRGKDEEDDKEVEEADEE